MKKILLLTDNNKQYYRIREIFEKNKNLLEYEVNYRHGPIRSAIWDEPDFKGKNLIVDVKKEMTELINNYDLIISVHCFQFFPKDLVESVRCVNVHPGYNPINRGWYPQVFAIIHDLPIGATIHEMDDKLDNGGIIARDFVEKYEWDTSLTLYERVLEKEVGLFEEHFNEIIKGDYKLTKPESEGNLFKKKDFKELCEIDINAIGTFGDFYNLLRALSHGEYKNAYFVPACKKKIFLKLDITIANE